MPSIKVFAFHCNQSRLIFLHIQMVSCGFQIFFQSFQLGLVWVYYYFERKFFHSSMSKIQVLVNCTISWNSSSLRTKGSSTWDYCLQSTKLNSGKIFIRKLTGHASKSRLSIKPNFTHTLSIFLGLSIEILSVYAYLVSTNRYFELRVTNFFCNQQGSYLSQLFYIVTFVLFSVTKLGLIR